MIPIISIVGKSGSGKTTLLEKLIPELKRRGYRVGTIKHDVHSFDIDHPGKDTWRHAQAGSDHVVISSPQRVASIRRVRQEISLEQLVTTMTDVDVVLTEGYKRGSAPKIEVSRRACSQELICREEELLAVACDHPCQVNVPLYALNDVEGLVDLIEAEILRMNRAIAEIKLPAAASAP